MSTQLKPEIKHLAYGSREHNQILAAIRQRFKMSRDKMSQRHDKWAEQEELAQAYIRPTENDAKRANLRKAGKPQYTTIEVPYSYAMLLTAHTYWTSVFLSRSPVMQFEARHGEPQQNVLAVEALLDYQNTVANWLVPLYVWLLDHGKYGLGVIGEYWAEEAVYTTEVIEVPISYFGISTGKSKKVRQTVRIPAFSGNRLFNVRPQDFFPDPRVSIARFQEGEFCGRRTDIGWNTIQRRTADGIYYNIEQAKATLSDSALNRAEGSSQLILPDSMNTYYASSDAGDKEAKSSFTLEEMTIELVPREWGLGTSSYPEKWCFSVINEKVIVSAQPQGLYHDKFAYSVLEYEVEGYSFSKRSMMEVLDPLNDTLSWLFNSHMHNVRKTMNDQLVVDPSRVVMKDLLDPNAGRLIRLKPEAYGTPVGDAVSQLAIADVTQNHLRDAQVVMDLMQRVTGVVDNVMGMVNSGGRKTATEVRTSSSFGVNRLKTSCEYASALGFSPLAARLLQNTQQRYDGDKMFKIAGDLISQKTPIQVTPDVITGFYDYVPIDGTMPVDRFAQASLWKELFMVFKQFPELSMAYDIPGIMGMVAQLSGVKNLNQFRLSAQPEESIQNEVTKGNLIPLKGAMNGGTSGTNRDFTQIPQTGGIPGVGRAG